MASDKIRSFEKKVLLVGAVFYGLFALLCLASQKAAFPGFQSDAGGHAALAWVWILNPEQYLVFPPPYSGILGSQFLAALLYKIGIPLSKALVLVADASLVLIVASVVLVNRLTGRDQAWILWAVLLLFSIPFYAATLCMGFYAQSVSMGFYAISFYFFLKGVSLNLPRYLVHALIMFGIGGLCYPDAAMWLAPIITFPYLFSYKNKINSLFSKFLWGAGLLASIAIIYHQFKLQKLDGAGGTNFENLIFPFGFVVFSILFSVYKNKNHNNRPARVLIVSISFYLLVTTILTLLSLYGQGQVTYYARKNYFSLIFFAPVLFPLIYELRGKFLQLASFAFVYFMVGTVTFEDQNISSLYDRLLRPRGPVDARDEFCIKELSKIARDSGCTSLFALPAAPFESRNDGTGSRIARVAFYNAALGQYNSHNFTIPFPEHEIVYFPVGVELFYRPESVLKFVDPFGKIGCFIGNDIVFQKSLYIPSANCGSSDLRLWIKK